MNQLPNLVEFFKLSISRLFLLLAWLLYVGYLLLSDYSPGASLLHIEPATLKEAMDLSLNFWFVMPLAFPHIAPHLSPTLEGLFGVAQIRYEMASIR